jgi:alpha-ribazole phosphatase
MKLVLVRHTRVAVPEGTIYGQADVPLAATAEADLAAVHELLPELCRYVYSSPLGRCRQLTNTLAVRYRVRPVWDNRLMEMNFGDWEGKRWEDIPRAQARYWGNHWQTEPAPGGESFQDIVLRVKQFWQQCLTHDADETVIVVSHSGPIRCLCLQLHPEYQLWPQHKAFKIPLDYGGVIGFSFGQ